MTISSMGDKSSSVGQHYRRALARKWSVFSLVVLSLVSLAGLAVFWWSDTFDNTVVENLQLRNGTLSFAWWQRPPVKAVYRIRIFNYTNVEDYEAGRAEKLRVRELGPYVYREILTRVNAQLGPNGSVTYQEMRSFEWIGGIKDTENVTVPNVPLFTAMAYARDMNMFVRIGLTGVLSTLRAKTFITLPARDFLWGYDDKLFEMSRPIMALPMEKFGIMAFKAGLSKDRITINTGTEDMRELGLFREINGKTSRGVWSEEECDRVDGGGTDGTMFPPHLVRDRNATLKVYAKEMCRVLPLRYDSESSAHGVPTLRYKLPKDVFGKNEENACYCDETEDWDGTRHQVCPPEGLHNSSSCNFGAPMLSSFPHFYRADPRLLEEVDGLSPDPELHDSYVDLHSRLGVPIGGKSRVQINMEARKASSVPFMGRIKDGTILPLIWIEIGIDEIPEPVMEVIRRAHFTANTVETCLQWGSILGLMTSLGTLLYVLRKNKLRMHTTLHRNVSGQNPLIEAAA